MTRRTVAILGGYGTFGRHIAEDLATRLDVRLIIAGRNAQRGAPFASSLGADFQQCDVKDSGSLKNAVTDAWLVLNTSGPFPANDYTIPLACIEAGCHYIDIADGRDFVAGIAQLDAAARARDVFVCAGASTTPAITSALVADLRRHVNPLTSIKVALSAGNKNPAGVSTIGAILSYVGIPIEVWHERAWRSMRGWSAGEYVDFPTPVGRRRVQLCNVPDLALFPQRFQADSVVFKAGVELRILNYAIGTLAMLRRVLPAVNLPSFAGKLVSASALFRRFGTLNGACAVWVTDAQGKQKCVALVAPKNGPRIPGSPAILLSRKLLSNQISHRGAFPCIDFLTLAEFADFLAPYEIFVVHGENGAWLP